MLPESIPVSVIMWSSIILTPNRTANYIFAIKHYSNSKQNLTV